MWWSGNILQHFLIDRILRFCWLDRLLDMHVQKCHFAKPRKCSNSIAEMLFVGAFGW